MQICVKSDFADNSETESNQDNWKYWSYLSRIKRCVTELQIKETFIRRAILDLVDFFSAIFDLGKGRCKRQYCYCWTNDWKWPSHYRVSQAEICICSVVILSLWHSLSLTVFGTNWHKWCFHPSFINYFKQQF